MIGYLRTGHFVQIHRDAHSGRKTTPETVEVEGRKVFRTVKVSTWNMEKPGWSNVGREMKLRDARKIAKAYQRAGFPVQVLLRTNDGRAKVVKSYDKPRNAA